jgi:hypothetical protein
MFDRSACARVRVAADAHVNLAALVALTTLLRSTSSKALLSGALGLSHDQNQGEVHATADEATSEATPGPQQIDLFTEKPQNAIGNMPAWSTLPIDVQAALTSLMTRLILEHAYASRIGSMTETDHDL